MKKTHTVLPAVICILALLAGCGKSGPAPAADADTQPGPASDAIQTVHTVDELIAAITPGAVIQLADGTYDLSAAQSYGNRTGNPYVKWEDCYDGFQLLIHDLDDLTISGSGSSVTNLVAQPRNANVLAIEDCTHVTLQGFTAGHTVQAEACSGSVIYVSRCENVQLHKLGLYGCGAVGLNAGNTNGIVLLDSEIYDCSSSGIQLFGCRDVTVSRSPLHDIGKTFDGYNQGYTVFSLQNCDRVEVSGCTIDRNDTSYLLTANQSTGIRLYDNRVTDNTVINAMMTIGHSDVTVESTNVIENNLFSRWYEKNWDSLETERARDESGAEVFTDDPEPLHKTSAPAVSTQVLEGQMKQVKAATVDEFLAAIDSNTEIILTAELYDLSTAADYGEARRGHYTWEETFDGPQLVILGIENLSITGEDSAPEKHTLSAVPRYANVITFRSCKNTVVRGITAGHTVEPGFCMGGVLNYEHSDNQLIENCNLYGCGILGVSTQECDGVQVINDKIYECSYGGVSCYQTQNITVGGCEFWDLGGSTFQMMSCSGVTIDGQEVNGDYWGD